MSTAKWQNFAGSKKFFNSNGFGEINPKKAKITTFFVTFLLKNPQNFAIQFIVISIQYFDYPMDWTLLSNPLDSQKTNLLKTKTVDFSINKKQFHQIISKQSIITILFLLKNIKNYSIILVISI